MVSQANARHLTMIENISDVIEIADINGVTKYISPNIQHDFGWTADDMMGKSGFEFVHPDDYPCVRRMYKELLKTPGIVLSAEFRIRCKDGNYKYIEISGRNLLNDPLIEGFLLNYRDISERKETEEEIRFLSFHDSLTTLYNRSFFEAEKKRLDTDRTAPIHHYGKVKG
jgi:PAS domain S-box-containing protein